MCGTRFAGFIEREFLYMHPDIDLADGDALLALGVIDSLGFVELVEEVQSRYGIAVEDVEITEEQLRVDRRRSSASSIRSGLRLDGSDAGGRSAGDRGALPGR